MILEKLQQCKNGTVFSWIPLAFDGLESSFANYATCDIRTLHLI
jgi:hypothetical protein